MTYERSRGGRYAISALRNKRATIAWVHSSVLSRMSHSNWGSDTPHRYGIAHVLAGWVVAIILALLISSDLIAYVLTSRDLERREIECRRQQVQEYAERKTATGKKQPPSPPNSSKDPEKIARDYCIQRRSAEVADDQARIARWSGLISGIALFAAAFAIAVAAWAAKGTWIAAEHAASAAKQTARSVDAQMRSEQPHPIVAEIDVLKDARYYGANASTRRVLAFAP